MTFQIEKLRAVVAWAEEEHMKTLADDTYDPRWKQEEWVTPDGGVIRDGIYDSTCGTAFCIAGKLCIDAGYPLVVDNFALRTGPDGEPPAQSAITVLGIPYEDDEGREWAHVMFRGSNSIEAVRRIAERLAQHYGHTL